MNSLSFFVTAGLLFSSISYATGWEIDTSPTVLGSAKLDGTYTQFACYHGSVSESWVSVPVSGFNDFIIETNDEDINLTPGTIRITAAAYSTKRVKRTLVSPKLDSQFRNDSRCKNEIFLEYEIGGVIRLSKEFHLAPEDMERAKKILEKVESVEDFYDIDLSAIKSVSGAGIAFGSSDRNLDLNDLWSANSREGFLKAAGEAVNTLNHLYPAERAFRLEFSPASIISIYLDRPYRSGPINLNVQCICKANLLLALHPAGLICFNDILRLQN